MIALFLLLGGFSWAAPAGRTPAIVGGIQYAPVGSQWFDLEPGRDFLLSQEVHLGSGAYPAGMALFLEERESLSVPGAPMSYFTLTQVPCTTPAWKSDLEIIVPAGNGEASAVGVEVSEGCHWGIYVEDKDLFQPSLLTIP